MDSYGKLIRVMLIDDHQTMIWGLEKLIESASQKMVVVGTAKTCDEALEKVEDLAPNLILLDLDLGGRNAIDIIPELKSKTKACILVLTGTRDQLQLDQAIVKGARGVIRKDASADQLLRAIEKVHLGEIWVDNEMLGRVLGGLINPIEEKTPDAEGQRIMRLTAKEKKIVHMLVEQSGASNRAIAERLFISEHTLRNHLTSIYQKLEVSNRIELYVYAMKQKFGTALQSLPVPSSARRKPLTSPAHASDSVLSARSYS